jgi:ATP-binding cassette subfamily B protein
MKQIIRILQFTKQFWKYYVVTAVFIIAVSLLNLVNPLINKQIVDLIVAHVTGESHNWNKLFVFLGLIIFSDIIITLFTNITGYLGDRLGQKLNTFLSGKFLYHVLGLEVEYFDNHISGDLLNKLQRGIANITDFINQMLNSFLPFFLTAFFTVLFLAFYSWEIAVLLAILFPLYVLISEKSSKAWIKKQGKINKIQDHAYGRVVEVFSSIRVIKSFLSGLFEHRTFIQKRAEMEAIAKKQSKEWHTFDVYRRLILNIILFGIYTYVIYYTYVGRYTIGQMTLLLQLVTQARFPLFAMSFILGQVQSAQAGSKDFFDVLSQRSKIKDKEGALELKKVKGLIAFKDVSFRYGKGKEILKDILFTVKPGEKLALVGESGGGKSTIANLLLRFYEPIHGSICIDDQDIQNVTLHSLHKHIAVVLQDSFLFSGTIFDNIAYGKPEAAREEIIEAARAANADTFIRTFPKGYKTEIGERGVKLSGGQKQRLSIARAILKDAPVLILDEATSSLDSKAEQEVQKALNKLMEGRTTIIIAHRLATIKNVNHIIVIKDGKIVEEGSPTSLLEREGIYAELVHLQSTITLPQEEKKKKLGEFNLNV